MNPKPEHPDIMTPGHKAANDVYRDQVIRISELETDRAALIEALRPLANDWEGRNAHVKSLPDESLRQLRSIPNSHTCLDEKNAAELLARMEGKCNSE